MHLVQELNVGTVKDPLVFFECEESALTLPPILL